MRARLHDRDDFLAVVEVAPHLVALPRAVDAEDLVDVAVERDAHHAQLFELGLVGEHVIARAHQARRLLGQRAAKRRVGRGLGGVQRGGGVERLRRLRYFEAQP